MMRTSSPSELAANMADDQTLSMPAAERLKLYLRETHDTKDEPWTFVMNGDELAARAYVQAMRMSMSRLRNKARLHGVAVGNFTLTVISYTPLDNGTVAVCIQRRYKDTKRALGRSALDNLRLL